MYINYNLFYIVVATNCSILACQGNFICQEKGGVYKCVCSPDYTGINCGKLGKQILNLRV